MNNVTVVIVNYNAKDYLERCVRSVYEETASPGLQIVVVDNASDERDFSELQRRYPQLTVLQNISNLGFACACNQGIRRHPSDFYLLLNPDCLILNHAVDRSLEFLRSRPEVGIVGCRVQNPDGSLQLACRRAIPRPATALYRFSGLSRLFPKSRRLARYNLSFLDENKAQEVEAVSGSFLMFRARLLDDIGELDEGFFLYGEDLDFCYRATMKGWKVFYYPEATVTHFKRRSSSRASEASARHYYDAMEIFYRKHYGAQAGSLQNLLVVAGIRLLRGRDYLRRRILCRTEVGSPF